MLFEHFLCLCLASFWEVNIRVSPLWCDIVSFLFDAFLPDFVVYEPQRYMGGEGGGRGDWAGEYM